MLIRIGNFNNSDTVLDTPGHLLNSSVITAGRNYTIRDGKLGARRGYAEIYAGCPIAAYGIFGGYSGITPYYLIAGLTKIYSLSSGVFMNSTRQIAGADVDYNASENTLWTGSAFNGLGIFNNSADVPQVFTAPGARCADMANWPATLRCASLRPFKNFLIAVNIKEGGGEYPQVLRWSHPADPGTVPSSWDYTDPASDAGRTAIAETNGYLVDSLASQDVHIVYKSDSIYFMQFVGAPYIFNIQRISAAAGLLSQNCMANIPGGQIALTNDDVIFVTPQGIKSIATSRIRRHLFAYLNAAKFQASFVVANPAQTEVWVCVPSTASYANFAYIWNWVTDKWTLRELPEMTAMVYGAAVSANNLWDMASGTWDMVSNIWGGIDAVNMELVGTSVADGGTVYSFDVGYNDGAAATNVQIMHESADMLNEQIPPERMRLVKRIRPHFTDMSNGAQVQFRVGLRNGINESVRWTAPRVFTIGTTRDLFIRKQGRYLTWEITSTCGKQWELDSMDIELETGGDF